MKKFVFIVGCSIIGLGVLLWLAVRWVQGPAPEEAATDLRFVEVALPFRHDGNLDVSLPFMALSAIDVDGDGTDEVFLGNGHGHADGIFAFDGVGFRLLNEASEDVAKADDDATMGAASIDLDGDGLEELFVAREHGVFLYRNRGGRFTGQQIEFDMDEKTVPLSLALGDMDRDGFVDLYVSGYIRILDAEGETNFSDNYGGFSYLLHNRGDDTWEDISTSAGVFRQHNTFVAAFADLDNDGWSDLVVAQDTGVVETWQNNGDRTFTRMPNPTVSSYPMGLGVGDLNNDGLVDLYLSNVGRTLPEALLRGNLSEDASFNMNYMLLHNEGGFRFRDDALSRKAAVWGFGWGTTVADFDNDGRQDLYFSQNYVRFPGAKLLPLYPGRLLQQQGDGTFLSVEAAAGATNDKFGVTQIVSDFDGDGRLDLVLANLTGPARALLSRAADPSAAHGSLVVRLPSEARWLNTRVHVTTTNGTTLTRQLIASTGLGSDGTDVVHFGLGAATGIETVRVERPDGAFLTYHDVDPNGVLVVDPTAVMGVASPAEMPDSGGT